MRVSLYFRAWTPTEDLKIQESFIRFGPSWAVISQGLKGRSPTECRRRYLKKNVLPSLQTLARPDTPLGPERLKIEKSIATVINKAHAAGMRTSPTFPSLNVTRPLTKAQTAEWEGRIKGYDKVGSNWVLFQEEARIPKPYDRIAKLLPKHLPRWKIIKKGWSLTEDLVLREAFETHGPDWISIHYALPKRTWQECRKRLTLMSLNWNSYSEILQEATKEPFIE